MQTLQFTKMHGLGNDFILIPDGVPHLATAADLAIRLCDRRRGIGADGLVFLTPTSEANLAMRIFNPDGSEAEQCGNALRCVALYAYERLQIRRERLLVATASGVKIAEIQLVDGHAVAVRVAMGRPTLEAAAIPIAAQTNPVPTCRLELAGRSFEIHAVGIGVPHAVIFVDDLAGVPLEAWGSLIEQHALFPRKTNVEFVRRRHADELEMRVWERGVGVTLACGSGACATLVAAVRSGRSNRRAAVHMPGGSLHIEWAGDDQLFMTGPATFVFEGHITELPDWPKPSV
jgi:diaminopimelate epimerase